MRKLVLPVSIALACVASAWAQNTVSFDNQSGEPALVKLVGPTSSEIEVPNGTKQGVQASAGRYIIKVRYGTPGKFTYSKGEEFEVKETATSRSKTTITLHKVVAGNYDSKSISAAEFGELVATSAQPVQPKNPSKCIVAGPWELVVVSLSTTNKFEVTYNPQQKTTLTPAPDEVIALVKIRGKRLRQEYTPDEETQIKTWSLAPVLAAGRTLFEKAPFLSTGNFMLCYAQPSAGSSFHFAKLLSVTMASAQFTQRRATPSACPPQTKWKSRWHSPTTQKTNPR
jgi:hypothetical protein